MKKGLFFIIIVLFTSFSAFSQVRKSDSLVLVKIYSNTDGPNWTNNTNWLSGKVGTWYGIKIKDSSVVSINLKNNNLSGTLILTNSDSLPKLTTLDLSNNPNLSFYAPDTYDWLYYQKSLKKLYLDSTKFNLDSLYVSGVMDTVSAQAVQGHIIALGYYVNLKYLNAANNNINVMVFNRLPNSLKTLILANNNLSNNSFYGLIYLDSLKHIDLSYNNFTSTANIITNLANKDSLDYINFYGNKITDDIVTITQNLHADTLILGFNLISGSIDSAVQFLKNTSYLDISINKITGTVNSLYSLSNLKVLIALNNPMHGTLKGIEHLKNLQILNLSNDSLKDSIPSVMFDSLLYLKQLSLGNNLLSGPIPQNISNLSFLKILNLSRNKLTGKFPNSIWLNPSIQSVNLSYNFLHDSISSNIENDTSLEYLSISHNLLFGQFPSTLTYLKNLKTLDISHNHFTSLPNLSLLPNLKYIYIDHNYFDYQTFTTINLSLKRDNFIYSPQYKFPITGIPSLTSIKLFPQIKKGNFNVKYTWYNQDKIINTTDSILQVAASDTGAYFCIEKGALPDSTDTITLITEPYTLNLKLKNGILESEYNTLVALYKATDGDKWTNNSYWLSDTTVNSWFGVSITAAVHVGKILLSNNNLNGYIPDLSNLKYLDTLDISHNLIDSIPDLSSLQKLRQLKINSNFLKNIPKLPTSITDLDVSSNYLNFGDLEPILNYPNLQKYTYAPQHKIGQHKIIAPVVGSKVVLNGYTPGSKNNYFWYKNGQLIDRSAQCLPTPPELCPELVIQNFQYADTGSYYCKITDSLLPNLTLQTQNIDIIKAFSVTFHITDTNNVPLPGAVVYLVSYPKAITDSAGIAKIDFVKNAKDLLYYVNKDGYIPVQGTVTINDNNVDVYCKLTPISLKIHLNYAAGPLKNINTYLYTVTDSLVATEQTDSSGIAIFSPVPNGKYVIKISNPPYVPITDTVIILDQNVDRYYTIKNFSYKQFQIYPNPATNIIHIYAFTSQDSVNITLLNLKGQPVLKETFSNVKYLSIPVPENLQNGIYYLDIKNAVYHSVIPVIIMHRKNQ